MIDVVAGQVRVPELVIALASRAGRYRLEFCAAPPSDGLGISVVAGASVAKSQ